MNKENLLRLTGSMQQVASVRRVIYDEGRGKGLSAFEVQNGAMRFTALIDKCLDISELSYCGVNLTFLSKPGLQGLGHYDTNGVEAQRSIMGGLFFTCGFDNVGPPVMDNGELLTMHGRLRSTPAEHVCSDAFWRDGKYILQISGEMREAMLFGENLVLRRTIETEYDSHTIHIHDEVTNEGFSEQPMMLLYHFNLGYPLLNEGTRIEIPSCHVTPRDAAAAEGLESWNVIQKPLDNAPEYVFYHDIKSDCCGKASISAYNESLNRGIRLTYDTNQLPCFTEWQSRASGDYALGLEPGTCYVEGKPAERKRGTLPTILSMASRAFDLSITVI